MIDTLTIKSVGKKTMSCNFVCLTQLLVGEYRGNSVMRYWLDPSLVARFIRFNPQSSWSPMHICMRVEIYRCHIKG